MQKSKEEMIVKINETFDKIIVFILSYTVDLLVEILNIISIHYPYTIHTLSIKYLLSIYKCVIKLFSFIYQSEMIVKKSL